MQLKTNDTKPMVCPYQNAISVIGNVWALTIIKTFYLQEKFEQQTEVRFNELLKLLTPISGKTLSAKLKNLAEHKIIVRKVIDETPVKILYSLTEKGRALNIVMDQLAEWSLAWDMKPVSKSE